LCRFSGQAASNGRPAAGAFVTIRVTTSLAEERQTVQTASDGSYAANFTIKARANEPVDWEILAQTTGSQSASVIGRRILLQDDSLVTVQQGVDL
jgi:hypothetical protein